MGIGTRSRHLSLSRRVIEPYTHIGILPKRDYARPEMRESEREIMSRDVVTYFRHATLIWTIFRDSIMEM